MHENGTPLLHSAAVTVRADGRITTYTLERATITIGDADLPHFLCRGTLTHIASDPDVLLSRRARIRRAWAALWQEVLK